MPELLTKLDVSISDDFVENSREYKSQDPWVVVGKVYNPCDGRYDADEEPVECRLGQLLLKGVNETAVTPLVPLHHEVSGLQEAMALFNSLRPSDTYTRQETNHRWFR